MIYDKTKFFASLAQYEASYEYAAKRFFKMLRPYEEQLDTDVALMDVKTLQPICDKCFSSRRSTNAKYATILSGYARWCASEGFAVSDGLRSVSFDNPEKMELRSVGSAEHLEKILDAYFDAPSLGTVDVVYRTFLWLAFAGVKENEAVAVRKKDVTLRSSEVRAGGASFRIPPQGARDLRQACTLDQFLFIHPNYVTHKARFEGDLILRGVVSGRKTEAVNLHSLTSATSDKFLKNTSKDPRYAGLALTFRRVYLSGVFCRALERERTSGESVSFYEDIFRLSGEEARRKFETDPMTAQSVRQIHKMYIEDYKTWKSVFHPDAL